MFPAKSHLGLAPANPGGKKTFRVYPLIMDFLKPLLLFGLAAILLPVIIHLFNRSSSKPVDWGAMRFLRESVANRTRKIRLEDSLLLACRCLLVALFALALSRPFSVAGAPIPWLFVLPLGLLGIALLGAAVAVWRSASWASALLLLGVVCLVLCGILVVMEKRFQLRRFGGGGATDIALVIDGSSSMNQKVGEADGGVTNFDKAIDEAKQFIKESGADNAFSLVIAGPVPRLMTPTPVQGRDQMEVLLDEVRPSGSAADMLAAMEAASRSVHKGSRQEKQIVVFTDGQDRGWHLENPGRWLNFRTDLEADTMQPPKVVIRTLDRPEQQLNAAVTDVRLARDIVGTDRAVTLEADFLNTGDEDLPPTEVTLRVDGEILEPASLGAMSPGQHETLRFRHRFGRPGPHRVSVGIERDDDIADDNLFERVISIVGHLPVLLVNGKPGQNVMDRASTFAQFALAPASGQASGQSHLVEPTVVEVAALPTVQSFQDFSAVVLCDVPTLPKTIARRLVDYVEQGGGLLLAPGERAFPDFYNEWRHNGENFLPAALESRRPPIPDEAPVKPDATTCLSPSLRVIASDRDTDFSDTLLDRGWLLSENEHVQGRWTDGQPFLSGKRYGDGNVLMLSCGLTPDDSSLPTRLAFVPFLHEIVYHLAQPNHLELHLQPSRSLVLPLDKGTTRHGLWMEMRALGDDAARFANTAPGINFNFDEDPIPGLPEDLFSAQWTGELHPPISGTYHFRARCDESFVLQLGAKTVLERSNPGLVEGKALLVEGVPVPLNARYEEDDGLAFIDLQWIVPGDAVWRIPPASVFRPAGKSAGREANDSVVANLMLTGPDGGSGSAARELSILHGPSGLKAMVDEDVMPGTYSAEVPPMLRTALGGAMNPEGRLEFSVHADHTESDWKALDAEGFGKVTQSLNVQRASNIDEVLDMLSGTVYGKELWRILAIATLLLLLGEVALTRWISRNRSPDPTPIAFDGPGKTSEGFSRTVERVKALR